MKKRYSKILVTGSTGFLGKPLVARLQSDGYQVTALGFRASKSPFTPEVEYFSGDLTTPGGLASIIPWRWEAVIHLAGPLPKPGGEDQAMMSQHVDMVAGLLSQLPPDWKGRWIHASSMTVYQTPHALPVREDFIRKPESAYGSAKLLAEDMLFAATAKISDLWCLRFPGLFSESRKSGALYHFAQSLAEGKPLRIQAKTPTAWDVLHVEEAIDAISKALGSTKQNPGAINVGYGERIELEAIAQRLVLLAASPSVIQNEAHVKHPPFQMDISKAREWLEWMPPSLESRLKTLLSSAGVPLPDEAPGAMAV